MHQIRVCLGVTRNQVIDGFMVCFSIVTCFHISSTQLFQ